MARKLTHKEKGFVSDILAGETGTQAALNNYDTENENVAAAIASENLRKPKIQDAIDEALPDEILAKVHLEGLSAMTYYQEGLGAGETQLVEKPDYSVRHRYLESAYKKKGKYKEIEGKGNTFVQVNIVSYGNNNPAPIQTKTISI